MPRCHLSAAAFIYAIVIDALMITFAFIIVEMPLRYHHADADYFHYFEHTLHYAMSRSHLLRLLPCLRRRPYATLPLVSFHALMLPLCHSILFHAMPSHRFMPSSRQHHFLRYFSLIV